MSSKHPMEAEKDILVGDESRRKVEYCVTVVYSARVTMEFYFWCIEQECTRQRDS